MSFISREKLSTISSNFSESIANPFILFTNSCLLSTKSITSSINVTNGSYSSFISFTFNSKSSKSERLVPDSNCSLLESTLPNILIKPFSILLSPDKLFLTKV